MLKQLGWHSLEQHRLSYQLSMFYKIQQGFHRGGEKMKNASGQPVATYKVKMSGSEKNRSEQERKEKFWWAHTTIIL